MEKERLLCIVFGLNVRLRSERSSAIAYRKVPLSSKEARFRRSVDLFPNQPKLDTEQRPFKGNFDTDSEVGVYFNESLLIHHLWFSRVDQTGVVLDPGRIEDKIG